MGACAPRFRRKGVSPLCKLAARDLLVAIESYPAPCITAVCTRLAHMRVHSVRTANGGLS